MKTMLNVVSVVLATAMLAVPVLRFQDGLKKGMRTADAGRYAIFLR